jgi:polyhydroxyalkanoate synthesis regulator phasin
MSGPHADHLHELPERLRVFADNEARCGRLGQQQELIDAANEIERLRKRVEDLEPKTR